jgi:hypothetical protein
MDPDSDPAIFVIDLQDTNEKKFLFLFYCLLLFKGTYTSFFKNKKPKRSHKAAGIKGFLTFMYRRPTLYPLEIAVDFLKSP